jgi:hypothetical protein
VILLKAAIPVKPKTAENRFRRPSYGYDLKSQPDFGKPVQNNLKLGLTLTRPRDYS